MTPLFNLQEKKLLKDILDYAEEKKLKLYLVGGILRDYLLKVKKDNPDIDFCLKGSAIKFGRFLAKRIKAGFVVLDAEHGACRVVKKLGGRLYTLDFTDFRAPTLEKDLLHRDFTINAIALEPEKIFIRGDIKLSLIDPYAGRKDLDLKIIRAVSKIAFDEDPLRILRAFSFSSALGFKIEQTAVDSIKSKRNKLSAVSGERVRDEIFKILRTQNAYSCFKRMDELGVLEVVFPEIKFMRKVNQGPYHHLDVWQHSLEALKQIERAIKSFEDDHRVGEYLSEEISSGRQRIALIKLGALLHDIGKPKARRRMGRKIIFHGHERVGLDYVVDIAQRLKLSNDETRSLKKMVFFHLRPGFLADNQPVTRRAIFRYFRDTAQEALSVLLVSLADQRSTRGRLTTRQSRSRHEKLVSDLVREYFKAKQEKAPVKLINGDLLIKEFNLSPSPLIGKILRHTEELQAIGTIKTPEEALKAAGKFLKKQAKSTA